MHLRDECAMTRLGAAHGRVPGPWAGEVRRLVPGVEIETLLII